MATFLLALNNVAQYFNYDTDTEIGNPARVFLVLIVIFSIKLLVTYKNMFAGGTFEKVLLTSLFTLIFFVVGGIFYVQMVFPILDGSVDNIFSLKTANNVGVIIFGTMILVSFYFAYKTVSDYTNDLGI